MIKIKYVIGICRCCGQEGWITNKSLGLRLWCDNKRKSALYRKRRKEREKKGEKTDRTKLAKFFKHYWETHPNHVCYETGEPLYFYKSWYIHHLIEKDGREDLAFKEDNIIYLSQQQHSLWHNLAESEREKKMPKTYQKWIETKQKYNV